MIQIPRLIHESDQHSSHCQNQVYKAKVNSVSGDETTDCVYQVKINRVKYMASMLTIILTAIFSTEFSMPQQVQTQVNLMAEPLMEERLHLFRNEQKISLKLLLLQIYRLKLRHLKLRRKSRTLVTRIKSSQSSIVHAWVTELVEIPFS